MPKSVVVDDWELIAQNAVREGAEQNITNWQDTTVFIAIGMATTTTNTNGTVFHIYTSPVDTNNEAWFEQASITLAGAIQASPAVCDVTPNAASTTILCDWAGGRWDDDGIRQIFLLGSPTVANSEICILTSHVTGAASSVTILDPLTQTIGASSTFWDFAETYIYELPKQANRLKVVHDNTYSSTGASVYTYVAVYGVRP